MPTLKLLQFDCSVPGLLRINGVFAGQTPNPELCHYVSDSRLYLEFLPLSSTSAGQYLPFTRMIHLGSEPEVVQNDGIVQLYLLSDSVIILHITPPLLPVASVPHSLGSLRFSWNHSQYLAEVYRDGNIYFGLYDQSGSVLFTHLFSDADISEVQLFTHHIQNRTYLFVRGNIAERIRLLCIDIAERRICFLHTCLHYRLADTSVTLICDNDCKEVKLRLVYPSLPASAHKTYLAELESSSARALAIGFLQAVLYKDSVQGMQLLSPDLREQLSFSDLQEFIGDIHAVFLPLCSDTQIAVLLPHRLHIYHIRLFSFEISQGKISNLAEQSPFAILPLQSGCGIVNDE